MIDVIWLENDKELMNSYEVLFRAHGFNIVKCTTAAQALKYLTEDNYSCLLLDIEFPDSQRDGVLFLEQLINLKMKVSAVILTAYPLLKEALDLYKNKKIDDYIEKPIPFDETGQFLFFERLKKSFLDRRVDPAIEKKLLKKWRLATWLNLLISLVVFILIWTVIAWRNSWNFMALFSVIGHNMIFSYGFIFGWTLINTFLFRALYDKYYNHSNIKAYLEKAKAAS
jgi:CheY-like chemotaxis protein